MALDTREKILLAAREIFVEKGKDGARMQEIADRAGVNKALLHYYFTSKELLYQEILSSVFKKLFQNLAQQFTGPRTVEEMLRVIVENHIDFVAANRDILKLMGFALLQGDRETYNPLIEIIKNEFKIPTTVFRVFEQAMQEGKIRPHNPLHTIISMISMNVFYFIIAPIVEQITPMPIDDEKVFLEERKQANVDLILNGILLKK